MSPYASHQKGFTLLETLVVMSIIAIMMSLVVISVNTSDHRRDLRTEALHFEKLLSLLIDEAIFQQRDIGLKLYEHHIAFLTFDERSQTWQTFQEDSDNQNSTQFKDYQFPGFIEIALEMEDVELFLNPKDELEQSIASINPLENFEQFSEEEEEVIEPDIYIFSSGEVTPFELEFRSELSDSHRYLISVNDIGIVSCLQFFEGEQPC